MSTALHVGAPRISPVQRLYRRELEHYPDTGPRFFQLGVVVLATVILYYENYIGGAVATQLLADLNMTFNYYVIILVIANALGAAASAATGLADRFGRANLVAYGLALTGLITLFGLPNADSKFSFGVLTAILGVVEGIILVATPALVRDFSPQLGRASAMGFWTLGPVVGSLVVSMVSSNTLDSHPRWQDQFIICGIVGLVVFVIAFFTLRELAPAIRDQLMVSLKDRELIEARARGIDVEAELERPFARVFTAPIVLSALAISLFLLGYYTAVAFFPIFFQTVQGFTADQANGLLNYYWAFNAITLIIAGLLSDRLRVRKPFMLFGGIGSVVCSFLLYHFTPDTTTSYRAWAITLAFVGIYGALAFSTWMASFTETVEQKSPALIAHGLAVWGLLLRIVVAVSFLLLPQVINSVNPLVENGAAVQAAAARQEAILPTVQANQAFLNDIQTRYPDGNVPDDVAKTVVETVGAEVATALQDPAVKADIALLSESGEEVQQAQKDSPRQWQHWFLVCLLGQLLFLPAVFLLKGPWSARKAREQALEHDRIVQAELAAMSEPTTSVY
ncbi:MAG: transporter [Frankiales bacterium]|nr:transporter [Frankiales bacterium]